MMDTGLNSRQASRAPAAARVRCREISPSDLDALVGLLVEGLRGNRTFWLHVIACLSERPVPEGHPRYGYLLEKEGLPVGVLLLIFSTIRDSGTTFVRGNVSSWYVKPEFQIYAPLLVSRALRDKSVTYLNITAAPHTLPIMTALGYRKYSSGRFIAVPALHGTPPDSRIEVISRDTREGRGIRPFDISLLLDHASYGCIGIICDVGGLRYPFVLAPRRMYGILPFAFLIYCNGVESFVQCAGLIGRFLLRRGTPAVLVDANGPVTGLRGLYQDKNPKYFKGPHPVSIGDLAYTERAMFDV